MWHFTEQIIQGLDYLHNQVRKHDGTPVIIIHRNLKPSNLFITADRTIKLADFCFARLLDE